MSDQAYQVLGVVPDATSEQVQQACYQLAKKWFPARSPLPPDQYQEAEQKFLEIVGAYEGIVRGGGAISVSRLEHYPNSARLFYEAAKDKDAQTEAIDDLNIALHLNPDYAEAYGLRGSLHLKQGFESRSVADLKRAQALGLEIFTALKPTPVSSEPQAIAPDVTEMETTLTTAVSDSPAVPQERREAEQSGSPAEAIPASEPKPDSLIVQFKLGLLLVFVCVLTTVSLAALSWLNNTEGNDESQPVPESLQE